MKKKKFYVSPEVSVVDSLDVTILAGSDPSAKTTESIDDATNEDDDEGYDFNDFMGNN